MILIIAIFTVFFVRKAFKYYENNKQKGIIKNTKKEVIRTNICYNCNNVVDKNK